MSAAGETPDLTLVVPVKDEARVLEELIGTVTAILDGTGRSYEVVVVDDGSTDDTAVILGRLAASDLPVVPVLLSRNWGKEAAMAAGMDAARGRAVILMDGDLQHPPGLLPEMIRKWEEGHDVVNGVRADRGRVGPLYKLGAGLFYRLLGGGPGFQRQSDFKLLDRQVVDALQGCQERHRFLRGLVAWVGFRVAEVPFKVAERRRGGTRWSPSSLVRYAGRTIMSFSALPLVAIAWLGVITTAAAALLAIQTFWNWVRGAAVSGFTTTILSTLLVGGAVLVCLAVVAAYLAVIYDEVKARPLYLVRREQSGARHGGGPRAAPPAGDDRPHQEPREGDA